MHLDLSDTGMTERMLMAVVKGIKSATRLMGVHLSGNEGLNEDVIDKIRRQMDATYEKKLRVNFQDIIE